MTRLRRSIAIILAGGFLAYAEMLGPRGLGCVAAVFMILPMAAILFGDRAGSSNAELLGVRGYEMIVESLGWIVLFCTPLLLHAIKWKLELVQ